ncbi:MAG: hypothetical protein J5829_00285 [Lachnospiraceae bacterium]|nr:hypothetical protein [Lachnospiraceae bacterium]
MSSSERKQIKHKKQYHLNAGVLIFGAIFVYILFVLYAYQHTTHLTGYEVTMGSLAVDCAYRGVAVRHEELVSINDVGYINYYAKENEHVSKGGLVYSVDESGTLSRMIEDGRMVSGVLSDEDLKELKNELVSSSFSYDDKNFKHIYGIKDSIKSTIRRLASVSALASLKSLSGNAAANHVNMGYSPDPGVVIYSTDGLESLKSGEVNADILDEEKHEKTDLTDGRLVGDGDTAFKIVTDENWSIVIPADEALKETIGDDSYVKVRFVENDYESWGKVNFLENEDGLYLELAFTNSMITFASERYIDVELELSESKGLKVPNSAIVKMEFYLIPEDYLTVGTNEAGGFIRRTYLEDGSESTEFVAADVYNNVDGMLYIDTSVFNSGDVIIKPDSADTYTVKDRDTLTGVYNMNKGYADFTNIEIINSNTEYSIVSSKSKYDLQVYDYIVLDGDGVNDNDFVTETDTGINIK